MASRISLGPITLLKHFQVVYKIRIEFFRTSMIYLRVKTFLDGLNGQIIDCSFAEQGLKNVFFCCTNLVILNAKILYNRIYCRSASVVARLVEEWERKRLHRLSHVPYVVVKKMSQSKKRNCKDKIWMIVSDDLWSPQSKQSMLTNTNVSIEIE